MKVLNTAPYYWPEVGGLENVAKEITDRLHGHDGFEVTPVASCSCEEVNANHRLDGHTVHLRTTARLYHTPVGLGWQSTLQDLIREEDADLVLTHTPVPFMADVSVRAAAREDVPAVVFHHNDLDPRNGLHRAAIGAYRRLLGDRTLELADRILVTSREYARESEELSPFAAKTEVIPPGVDTDRFRPANAPPDAHEGPPEVVFVGRLDKTSSHKGLPVLLEALGRLDGDLAFRFSVVGEGDHREAYERQAHELGIADRCTFHGFVDDDRLAEIYARATTVCLPSTTRSEGFGLVLLEAQASGASVVGSDIGGIPQAIEDGQTGFLVEPGNPADLAAKLERLLGDPKHAEAMGKAGRKRVLEEFSWEVTADRMREALSEVGN